MEGQGISGGSLGSKQGSRDSSVARWPPTAAIATLLQNDTHKMVYLTRKIEFSASHYYHNPAMTPEENARVFGKSNNPHGHGHNYVLEVTVAGEPDPVTGMVLDLKELKDILQRQVMDRVDHRFLNQEVPELKGKIPTTENLAAVIWDWLEPKITQGSLHRVRLYMDPDLFVDCYGTKNGSV